MTRNMMLVLIALLALPVFAADTTPQAAPKEPANMKSLFNGKDLTGWDGDPRLWSVVELGLWISVH